MTYSSRRRFSVVLHDTFEADLEALWGQDEDAAALIFAFLEELQESQEMLDNLTRNKFIQYVEPSYSVEMWAEVQKQRYNLWRLKLLDLEGAAKTLRIIYAFDAQQMRYYMIAIVERDFNYDPSDDRSTRIFDAYSKLGIPRY